jgi:hypothetical protein
LNAIYNFETASSNQKSKNTTPTHYMED